MNTARNSAAANSPALPNGSGAAAILSAGMGCFALAVLAIIGDKSNLARSSLVFYPPTGPLSGISTCAILLWLLTWAVLELRWRKRTIAAGRTNLVALVLLALSFILTFPPLADLF